MSRWSPDDVAAYLEKRRGKTASELYAEVKARTASTTPTKRTKGKRKAKKARALKIRTSARVKRITAQRDERGVLRLELPVHLYNGNSGQTKHWSTTPKLRRGYLDAIRECYAKPQTPDYPQRMTITRVLGPRQQLWDTDSILRGSAKQLVDSLVEYGFVHDDGPTWITASIGLQDDSRREDGPMVIVEFAPD